MANKTNFEVNNNKYFRVTATVGKDSDGDTIRKTFYGKSKKDAENKRDEYVSNIKNGLVTDYRNIILSDMVHLWLYEVVRVSVKASTFERYESVYRKHIKPSDLSQMKVYEIKSVHLQRLYNDLSENQQKTKATIKSINKVLKSFFNYAISQDYILKNPCFKLVVPGENLEKEIDPFINEEIEKIKLELKDHKLEMLFLLSLGTGIRIGELLALTPADIDFNKNIINVGKSLKKVRVIEADGTHQYKLLITDPKTKASMRTVPVPTALISQLKSYLTSQKELYLKNGSRLTSDEFLFTTDTSLPYDNKNLLRAWQRALKRCDVRYRSWHTIRHTYATKLFEADIPLKKVQVLLGHANISITADTYTHVMPKEKNDAAEKLNFLFN